MTTTTATLSQQLTEAKTALAFALAQGDGYAEDAAAARIAELESQIVAAQQHKSRSD